MTEENNHTIAMVPIAQHRQHNPGSTAQPRNLVQWRTHRQQGSSSIKGRKQATENVEKYRQHYSN